MNKIVRLGKTQEGNVYCKIEYKDGRLSISGVIGPRSNGNCKGSCGQISMSLTPGDFLSFAPGWSAETVQTFLDYWNAWHLNDMRAGTPAQRAELARHTFDRSKGEDHYVWARRVLIEAGLNPDNGYRYGSAWLREEVPADVLEWLAALPDTDMKPAWV